MTNLWQSISPADYQAISTQSLKHMHAGSFYISITRVHCKVKVFITNLFYEDYNADVLVIVSDTFCYYGDPFLIRFN